ncbi:MAG: LVIVD repeat-containing protein [Gemmatimonadaceae bacterium]
MNGRLLPLISGLLLTACGSDKIVPPATSGELTVIGTATVADRYTAEIWVRGNVAYTTTWGFRNAPGNAVKIWDVSGSVPTLVDSLIVPGATTLGDVQTSDDGQLLIVATERSPGSIMIYSLSNPAKPQLVSRYTTALTDPGVHTAEVQRVNGRLYAFLCIDPATSSPARLVIVDITNPAAPTQVFTAVMGDPYVHDVYVRDGILFTALWDDGVGVWDIGGVGTGTVANPVSLGSFPTVNGEVHNIWWFHNAVAGEKRYLFVGEEAGPAAIGSASAGDIHVVDISNLASPREVAFFHVSGAGTHNFSVDENRGILYAAFYNGGVRAIDVTGDLSSCAAADKSPDGRCDLAKMGRELAHGPVGVGPVYIWGVQLVGLTVYASDMLNGIWKLGPASFPPD